MNGKDKRKVLIEPRGS